MPASSASSAASNSHLERRLAGLERLLEVTRVLAAEVDLKRILATIAGAACRAIDCERASIFQYDPKTRELYTSVATELEIQEIRKGIDSGISGYVARERRMLNVADPQSDSRWDSTVDLVTGFRTRSILAAPLVSSHDDSLLGVVQLLNNRGGPFDRTDEELLAAFSQHAAVALDRARLVEEIRRRQEVEVSLQVAREIQRGFMPENMPSIPGYQAASWWFPNQAVGGDYCDIVPMRDGRYCLCVADVSGHGLGPSLLMASVRAALRALLLDHASPRVLMELLGQAMSGDLRQGRFITIVVGLLDPRAHRLEFANAGHAPAIHYSAARRACRPLEPTGLPLGVVEGTPYPPGPPVTLEPGDMILLCTDGIVEAMNEREEQFGQERLERIVQDDASLPPVELVRRIGAAVEAYYTGSTPADDLTVLAVRRDR